MSDLYYLNVSGNSSPQPSTTTASIGEPSTEFDRLIHIIEESDSTSVGQIFRLEIEMILSCVLQYNLQHLAF